MKIKKRHAVFGGIALLTLADRFNENVTQCAVMERFSEWSSDGSKAAVNWSAAHDFFCDQNQSEQPKAE